MQQVCELDDDTLEVISLDCIDPRKITFLKSVADPPELMITWIQRAIALANDQLIIDIPPPILSRAFQELARGQVNFTNCKKVKMVQFPFPYAQMITGMLLVHWGMTAVITAQLISSWWCAGGVCAFVTCAFWSLFYIAMEIDQPFGSDANDLPVEYIQRTFNQSLLTLLDPEAADPPSLISDPSADMSPRFVASDPNVRRTVFSSFRSESDKFALPEGVAEDNWERQMTPGARRLSEGGQSYSWRVKSRCSIRQEAGVLADLQPQDTSDRPDLLLGNADILGRQSDTYSHPLADKRSDLPSDEELASPPDSLGTFPRPCYKADLEGGPVLPQAKLATPHTWDGESEGRRSVPSSEQNLCIEDGYDEKPVVPCSEQVLVLTSSDPRSGMRPPLCVLGAARSARC
eukprot:TRINITY_DN9601_c0_g1_i4.p1 TRINITY_DN9601_c0_g1~~TRINITY_DN9601_c0_g1_i4.p1  ORF type:complete len:440 (-),score=56.84 TRINITY_DN9601_c0_g1_i4:34-1245(-)